MHAYQSCLRFASVGCIWSFNYFYHFVLKTQQLYTYNCSNLCKCLKVCGSICCILFLYKYLKRNDDAMGLKVAWHMRHIGAIVS